MQKQIHVNSYVKKDGTEVKEHFRNINTDNSGIVLQGGISVDVEPSVEPPVENSAGNGGNVLETIGNVLKSLVSVGLELTPITLQIYQAMNSGNNQAIGYIKPQFDTKIKQLDTQVSQMKIDIDNFAKKLANTKSQTEYSKIYKTLQKKWQTYQQTANLINRIKVQANNNNYQAVADELRNFTNRNLSQITNPTIQNPQPIENIYNDISATVQKVKPKVNKFVEVAKNSKGPLYFFNNLSNYNRPEARKFMNLSLDLPKNMYSNSEYSMIHPIFNNKLNKYLYKIGTDLKVTKNMKGIVFEKSSSISQKLSNFEKLQKDIRVNYNQEIKYISGLGIDTDTNLQYTVGHFTILNPRIENGIFKGELFDIYDFDYISQKEFKKYITYLYNTAAYFLQEVRRLKNYYFLIPIEFKW